MPHPKHSAEILLDLLTTGDIASLRSLVRGLSRGEGARLVTRLDRDEQRQLLTLLPLEDAAQVLKELSLPQAAQALQALVPERAAALVEIFPSNEQADLLAEMDEDADAILASLSAETVQRVQQLGRGQRPVRIPVRTRACRSAVGAVGSIATRGERRNEPKLSCSSRTSDR